MYVINTWITANLIHPIVIIVSALVIGEHPTEAIIYSLVLSFLFFIISLPLAFFSWLFLVALTRFSITEEIKFFAWIFIATSIPLLLGLSAIIIVPGAWDINEFPFFLPASISIFITIMMRKKQFIELVTENK